MTKAERTQQGNLLRLTNRTEGEINVAGKAGGEGLKPWGSFTRCMHYAVPVRSRRGLGSGA